MVSTGPCLSAAEGGREDRALLASRQTGSHGLLLKQEAASIFFFPPFSEQEAGQRRQTSG